MQDSPPSIVNINSVLKPGKSKKTFRISATIVKTNYGKDISTIALINSGAEINCIDRAFVKRNKLKENKLPQPITARNADQSENTNGKITHTMTVFIRLHDIINKVTFHVINCGKEQLILGMPWLGRANPRINWADRSIVLQKGSDETQNLNEAMC